MGIQNQPLRELSQHLKSQSHFLSSPLPGCFPKRRRRKRRRSIDKFGGGVGDGKTYIISLSGQSQGLRGEGEGVGEGGWRGGGLEGGRRGMEKREVPMHSKRDRKDMEWTHTVLDHLLVHPFARFHLLALHCLLCSLFTARFAGALRCAYVH